MKTKHIFVPALDVGELVPFLVKEKNNLIDSIKEQKRAKTELEKFIEILQKNFKEKIYYIGMDIDEKTYERFIFEKSGFLEVMIESPLALVAHFIKEKRAKNFHVALKKSLFEILPKNKISELFINSIEVQTEKEQMLTYYKWNKMKKINNPF
ncbi:MAG: hypothetical protein ACLFPJ_01210 [Candidatus Woesearchaeota archaeon]